MEAMGRCKHDVTRKASVGERSDSSRLVKPTEPVSPDPTIGANGTGTLAL